MHVQLNAFFFPGPNDQVCTALLQLVEFHPSVLEVGIRYVVTFPLVSLSCSYCLFRPSQKSKTTFLFFPDATFTISQPHLKDVIKCMLQLNKDNNDAVALKACGFW